MSRSNHYPAVQGEVFSPQRLRQKLERGDPLPPTFRLGGRYSVDGSQTSIGDRAFSIDLASPPDGVAPGDLVILDVEATSFSFYSNVSSLKKWLKCEVVVRSAGDSEKHLAFSVDTAKLWSDFLATVRRHLTAVGLQEVTTPTLVFNPGMEPELEPFTAEVKRGRSSKRLFLATSPELHLKQLLVHGLSDIFEIKTVFRNEELTDFHEPEFHMLEWYRAFANLEAVERDLASLIEAVAGEGVKIQRYTVAELFSEATSFTLKPSTTRDELLELARRLELAPNAQHGWNDLFHLIWIAKVEFNLPQGPLLVHRYPPSQAALSRVGSHGWAERFELYWDGVEIANAFHELNDPNEQRERFVRDQKLRVEYGRTPLEIDENFMRALNHGMPPSGGIALGLDRLFMVVHGFKDLRTTRAFSVEHEFPLSNEKS